ncbi:MAG TPA: tetratricopeptide repeat protein [Anaerolineales bacterium]|nr:tetratricopeptide repeat protein [Anaerolineales bacterium]
MESPVHFGGWLQQRRKSMDLTQRELADLAGCSVFALRKIEAGDRRPSKQLAGLLARALDIPSEDQSTFIRVARGELNLERLQPPHPSYAAIFPTKPATLISQTNLPVPPNPLIGRENELSMLESLLADPKCRLLTLVGPGGIGKTRLGIEIATRIQESYSAGVCFVPLASLSSPTFLMQGIADSLGLTFQGQTEPKSQLLIHLRDKQILLVMDNVEHLLEGVGFFTEMLNSAPDLKLLVTSRERLNLLGEWVFEIQGLPVPASENSDHIESYGSIELFIQSACRVKANFTFQSEEISPVVRICQLVDGMPLGIELAAAWVSVLNCQEIAREIERNMDFLVTSLRDVPERQRSLRAVFEHSWKLLSQDERKVLSRLAIFRGGFTRQAAAQIASATLPLLLDLASKSLIRHKDNGRYDLHEVIRQYAYSYLSDDPECEDICDLHLKYYLGLLQKQEKALKGANQREAIGELTVEIDNVRAAWAWAIERQMFSTLGKMLRSYAWLCTVVGWLREGIEQIEPIVQALRLKPGEVEYQRILGVALALQGLLNFRKGDFKRALSLYEESLEVLRPMNDPVDMTDPLLYTGIIMHLVGNIDRAKTLLDEALNYALAIGDRWYEAFVVFNLGYLASLMGDYHGGFEQMKVGLALWRELGDPSSTALGLNYLGSTLIQLGRYAEAEANLWESVQLSQQVGDRWGLGTAYRNLGLVALRRGEIQEAIEHLNHGLDIFKGYIIGWDISISLLYLGEAKSRLGKIDEARQIYLEALRQALEYQSIPLALDAFVGLAGLQAKVGELELALVLITCVLNHPSIVFETKENANRLASEVKIQLQEKQIQTATLYASENSLQQIAEVILNQEQKFIG